VVIRSTTAVLRIRGVQPARRAARRQLRRPVCWELGVGSALLSWLLVVARQMKKDRVWSNTSHVACRIARSRVLCDVCRHREISEIASRQQHHSAGLVCQNAVKTSLSTPTPANTSDTLITSRSISPNNQLTNTHTHTCTFVDRAIRASGDQISNQPLNTTETKQFEGIEYVVVTMFTRNAIARTAVGSLRMPLSASAARPLSAAAAPAPRKKSFKIYRWNPDTKEKPSLSDYTVDLNE
jgi:hypothetical protein